MVPNAPQSGLFSDIVTSALNGTTWLLHFANQHISYNWLN